MNIATPGHPVHVALTVVQCWTPDPWNPHHWAHGAYLLWNHVGSVARGSWAARVRDLLPSPPPVPRCAGHWYVSPPDAPLPGAHLGATVNQPPPAPGSYL